VFKHPKHPPSYGLGIGLLTARIAVVPKLTENDCGCKFGKPNRKSLVQTTGIWTKKLRMKMMFRYAFHLHGWYSGRPEVCYKVLAASVPHACMSSRKRWNSSDALSIIIRCGRILKREFVANLPPRLPAKEVWKSVNIYEHEFSVLFFWLTVYLFACKKVT